MSNTESNTTITEISVGIDEGLLEWANYHLGKIELKVANVKDDLDDGFFLVMLIEMLTKDKFGEYHSRTFAETPISDTTLVEFNQKALRNWFAKLKIREESIVTGAEYQDLIKAILWYLVGKSVGHGGNLGKKCRARYETAKKLYEFEKSPFPYQGLGLEEKGSVVLLRTCILLDKLKIARENIKDKKLKKWVSAPQKYATVKPLEIKFKEERVIRVFLSSTFRDMQHERDEFFKNAVPELKRKAKEQGIELVFIDLRWGLTSEDSNGGWVVIRCLDSIAKCPYFVCSLGARYGWIPDQNKTELNLQQRLEELLKTKPDATMKDVWVEWHSVTNTRFPFIEKMPGLSVTEYEIQFACLIDKPACSRAFFYLRDEEYAVKHAMSDEERKLFQAESEEARKSQDKLKETVKSKFGHVVYKGAKKYADFVASHLAYAIEKDFGNETVRDPEDQAQHQFKMHRLAGFGGRVELLKNITDEVMSQLTTEGSKITVLAAMSGIGKSSLMAATARNLEEMKLFNVSILFHFVGCTNLSNYVESISIRFWTLVTNPQHSDGQKKSETEFEKEGLNGLFKMLQGKLSDQQYVFLIDAINQIHPSQGTPTPHLLTWLPKETPQNVAVVVSTIDTHESCKSVKDSGLGVIPVTKLTKDEIREGTRQFLKLYDKSLNEAQIGMILDDYEDTGHPLYLRIVLDEIRVFGVYEKLDRELETLLTTKGVIELYTLVITRWQKKYDKEASLFDGKEKKKIIEYVSISMKVLFVSRIGLSEGDLDVYMKDTIGQGFELPEWKSFFFTLIESLFVRNGRYMYFHQLLLETTEKVYFENIEEKVKTHEQYGKWLFGQYSEDANVDEELAAEICHQLLQGQSFELLVDYLRQKHVISIMLGGRYRYEFFNCWRAINEKGIANYTDVYRTLVKSLDKEGNMLVEFFLESFGNSFLLSVLTVRLGKEIAEESKAADYLTLGRVYKNLQNWAESMKYYNKCLDATKKSEDNELSVATIHEEMGFIFQQESKIDEALVEYEKSLDLRIKHLGDNDLQVAQCYDRFGDIYIVQKRIEEEKDQSAKNDYDEKKESEVVKESLTEKAQAQYLKSMEIRQKKVGNEHPLVARSYQNYGHVSLTEKKYEEAIRYYETAKSILEKSLGDRHASVATTIQYIARVHLETGKKKDTLGLLNQSVVIYVSALGENHPNVVSCYEQIGDISHDLKDFKEALTAYTKTLDIRKRTLGDKHPDYSTSLENIGRTNFELQSYAQAIDCFQKASTIRKETKTIMSLKNGPQIDNIIRFMKEKKEHESVIQLYKNLIHLFSQLYKLDNLGNWNCWIACENVHTYCKEHRLFNQAIEFWTEMRDRFTEKLGWTHPRTLNSCEYLSYHSRQTGINKEPVEFTRVKEFITENIGNVKLDEEWNRRQIIACLFQIIYMSRTDESKSKAASDAITLLNFMNVSFSGMDLSNIRIPDANLSNSMLDGADFTGANLDGVNFTNSMLGDCVFDESRMNSVKFAVPYEKLEGHTNVVSSVCSIQGPNGENWLASGSHDRTIRIWDIATGNQIKILEGHTDEVYSVCSIQGPNGGNWLVSGSGDKTIRIWDIATGNQIKILEGHTSYVMSVCSIQGPNGENWLASGSGDNTIRIWDIATGNQIKILEGHRESVYSVCSIQGPNGENWLASGSYDYKIRIWDIATGNQIKILQGHRGAVYSVWSIQGPNGEKWLASGSNDNTIRIWDITTGNQIKILEGHRGAVYSVCSIQWPNGEKWLASGSNDNTIRIWDITTGNQIKILEGHRGTVYSVCSIQGPNGENWLASGSDDKTIRIWDIATGNHIKILEGHENCVTSVCSLQGPNGENWLASGSRDKSICIWDIVTGNQIKILEGHTNYVRCVCSIQGLNGENWLASGSVDKTIRIWDIATGNQIKILEGHTNWVMSVCSIQGPNGQNWLASGSYDNTIRIWDIATGNQMHSLQKSEVTYTHGKNLVRKENTDEIIAIFNKSSDAMNLIDTNTISDGKTVQIIGPRKLQGGNIRLRNVKGLNEFNKRLLLSISATSFDEDFAKYCDEGKFTKFQAKMMAECYENGWGVQKDMEKAIEFYKKAENFEKLKQLAHEGSKDAFNVLREFAEMKEDILDWRGRKVGEKYKYPQAVSIVAECYENGWGVEKNAEMAAEWRKKVAQ